MKILCLQGLVLSSLIFLGACGTRDYEEAPPPETFPAEFTAPPLEQPRPYGDPDIVNEAVTESSPESSRGYLWGGLDWMGVSDRTLSDLECALANGPSVNEFQVFGTALLGGAILGMVIRHSGSWFFGKPPEPAANEWFWKRLERTTQTAGPGAVRGALFAGTCQIMFTGVDALSFDGMIGSNFSALSASLIMGGMSSLAAKPHIARLIGSESANAALTSTRMARLRERFGQPPTGSGPRAGAREALLRAGERVSEWSRTTSLGKGVRYRLAPGLFILGIGGGAGLLVYDWLHAEEDPNRVDPCLPMAELVLNE